MPPRPPEGKKWAMTATELDAYDRQLLAEFGLAQGLAEHDQAVAQAGFEKGLEWAADNAVEKHLTVESVERNSDGRIIGMKARSEVRAKPGSPSNLTSRPTHLLRSIGRTKVKGESHTLSETCSCHPVALVDMEHIDAPRLYLHEAKAQVGFREPRR